ncbi:histidine phosphatase family protein [Pseudomonas delhiensis]|uniref:histidine phosphatase family protein n=1 Tax=Pseudomonas delhiensis TaxID=366289 RepID=UPI003CC90D84
MVSVKPGPIQSFLDLVAREMHFLDRLAEQPANDIVAFSHGQLINTVVWLLERAPQEIDGLAIRD